MYLIAILIIIIALIFISRQGFYRKIENFLKLHNNEDIISAIQDFEIDKENAEQLFHDGQYVQAENIYIQALKKNPLDSFILNRLGLIYIEQERYVDAEESLQAAYQIDPKSELIMHNYSYTLIKLRKFDLAIEILLKLLKTDKSEKHWLALARCFRATERYDKQIIALKKALSYNRTNTDILELLLQSYLHLEQLEKARAVANKIIEIDKNNSVAIQLLKP